MWRPRSSLAIAPSDPVMSCKKAEKRGSISRVLVLTSDFLPVPASEFWPWSEPPTQKLFGSIPTTGEFNVVTFGPH